MRTGMKRTGFSRTTTALALITVASVAVISILAEVELQVGFALVTAGESDLKMPGAALFSYTNSDGVLVSQAAVGTDEAVHEGRVFGDEAETQTALVLLHASPARALVILH